MKEQNLKIYWCYDCHKKWLPLERPLLKSSVDVSDFLEAQDYFLEPDFVVGDEFNFIALFEHPFKEEYLFHLVVDDFSKVFFDPSIMEYAEDSSMHPLMKEAQKGMEPFQTYYERVVKDVCEQ